MLIGPKSAASFHGNTADIRSHAARKYQLAVKLMLVEARIAQHCEDATLLR